MIGSLHCAGRVVDLSEPRVMGILNVTPDSFSDGGQFFSGKPERDAILKHAASMVDAGAAFIDVGGESTRPGAAAVSVAQELDRVVPVVELIHNEFDVVVSVDTSNADVMREAVAAGAGLINDVRALQREGALAAAASLRVPVCLMHMQGEPGSMQQQPDYEDVVSEVSAFLMQRVALCRESGIPDEMMLLDPGFGFGKTLEHNLTLLRELGEFTNAGFPLLVGLSRKSMIGMISGAEVENRLPGSLVLALESVRRGAKLLRVHDVEPTIQALQVFQAIHGDGA
jgi:dihydropteroate synthase